MYGIFPYQNWIRTESEGWATYSATRLSKLIFQKYGPGIWHPAYNYAKRADFINGLLLEGHPLIWSHPEEVGAFKMYNEFEQKAGLREVYKDRWQYTSRNKYAIYIQENTPQVVNDFIKTKIGKDSFDRVSGIPPKKFDELYKLNDWNEIGHLNNISDDQIEKHIGQLKMGEININVPGPMNIPVSNEAILMVSLLLLFIIGNISFKKIL